MKKCQTEKELISIDLKKAKKSLNLKTLLSKIPKIPKIMLQIPISNLDDNFQKNHKKIFSNFLTNHNNYILNTENTNPNYLSLSNSHRTRIYQKKKIQKVKEAKKNLNLNINAFDNASNTKKIMLYKNNKNNNTINTESQKYYVNDSKITYQIRKYLNSNIYLNKNKIINGGINLEEEGLISDRYKRININNININLNNINKITNKIEYEDINTNDNNLRSANNTSNNNYKINDVHFLKKLNFNQPSNNINNINNPSSNEITLNNQNKILDRIKHKKNFIYKNKTKYSTNAIKEKPEKSNNIIIKLEQKKIKKKSLNNKKSKSFRQSLMKKTTNFKLIKNKEKNKYLSNNNIKSNNNNKIKNIEPNLITSESLTILDNSISYTNSFNNDSKSQTQSESEKDEKHTVVTTHQLNIFLNKAKKPFIKEKKLEFKNIIFSSINTNFKLLLIKFLDKKSLLILSSLNKTFYNNFRKKIYKYFYDKIIAQNGNKEFILKILSSLQKYASKNLIINNPKKTLKEKYEYYKKIKSKYDLIILQDISRTFPNEPNFSVNSINYKKLYNILIAYSNYNKNIGYAQGLNFLAARAIIIFKAEEKVFLFLDGLINRFNLGYFICINNNQELSKEIKYCSDLLNKYCNNFIGYLKSKLVNHDFFSTSWLLTLFSNCMDKKKLYICWSFMAIFGWKFFYAFIIQIILFYEKNLMKINESKLSNQMKELLKSNTFIKDFNTIIKNTFDFMEKNIVL